MDVHKLIALAKEAYKNSHAPYSEFHVGAALLCANGDIYTGCNVENGCCTSCCAERVALYKAVSEGNRDFIAVAVACDRLDEIFPCGICRQALAEFSSDIKIITKPDNIYTLSELLPNCFTRGDA